MLIIFGVFVLACAILFYLWAMLPLGGKAKYPEQHIPREMGKDDNYQELQKHLKK